MLAFTNSKVAYSQTQSSWSVIPDFIRRHFHGIVTSSRWNVHDEKSLFSLSGFQKFRKECQGIFVWKKNKLVDCSQIYIYFYNILKLRQNIAFLFISITTILIGKILKAKFTQNSCLQEDGKKSGLGNFFNRIICTILS